MTPTDPEAPAHIERDYDEEIPPSIAITRAIAALEEIDPVESPRNLGLRLYDHFDPEALDRFVMQTEGISNLHVLFNLQNTDEYVIQIRDDCIVVEKNGDLIQ